MPRRNSIPSYRLHKQSGQAIVTLPDGLGGRRDVLLGEHGSAASRKEYARVVAEWEANGRRLPRHSAAAEVLTVNEVILAYWPTVETYYRHPDGPPTSEVNNIRLALRRLKQLYGHTPAAAFDTLALGHVFSKAERQKGYRVATQERKMPSRLRAWLRKKIRRYYQQRRDRKRGTA